MRHTLLAPAVKLADDGFDISPRWRPQSPLLRRICVSTRPPPNTSSTLMAHRKRLAHI
jgi:gamma-glutamyltranspeptidase